MKLYIVLSTFFFFNQSCPDICRVDHWYHVKQQPGIELPQRLYLLHDVHNRDKNVWFRQRSDAFHFVRSTGSSLIVESSNKNKEKPCLHEVCKQVRYGSDSLMTLSLLTAYDGIRTTNVDFRLENPNESLHVLEGVVGERIRAILTYKDAPQLIQEYRRVIEVHQTIIAPAYRFVREHIDQIKAPEVQERAQSIINLYYPLRRVATLDENELMDILFVLYDTELVDLEMLHAVSEHGKQHVSSSVMYAGRDHLDRIKPLLTELGYRLVHTVKLGSSKGQLLSLREALHKIQPCYDPSEKYPKTKVDFLLDYIEFEYDHPQVACAIPATVVFGVIGIIGYLVSVFMIGSGK